MEDMNITDFSEGSAPEGYELISCELVGWEPDGQDVEWEYIVKKDGQFFRYSVWEVEEVIGEEPEEVFPFETTITIFR